jgi:predicted acylesterase/phospholipase RssA
MTTDIGARNNATQTQARDLTLSAGGSRAILGGSGAVLAIDQALGPVGPQLRASTMWNSIGGVSGGSIPAAMYAGGYSAREALRHALDIDFSSKLTRHGSIVQILFAYFMQGRFERTRPRHGVLSSEKLGDYIDEMLPQWPANYWTMAVVGTDQVLFDSTGVKLIHPDGTIKVISDKPAPMGIAIRATCAVPGIISAVPYKGRFLFDGALSPDGSCPVGIPMRFYGATHPSTIACEVGDDGGQTAKHVLKIWQILCGKNCIPHFDTKDLTEEHGMIVVKPDMKHFRSLQFNLSRDQKWLAVMTAYVATVASLKKAGLIPEDKLAQMEQICANWHEIEAVGKYADGLITLLVEDLLAKNGLY